MSSTPQSETGLFNILQFQFKNIAHGLFAGMCIFFFFCMCATQLTNAKRKSTTKNAEITFQDLKWYT